jgi:hypothetical protein
MPNQFLKLRRSAVPGRIPSTSSLDFGEIALNTYDGLAFIKKSGSIGEEIVTIGASTISVTGSRFFIPVFNTTSSLITSSIYQSSSFTAIGATTPVDPSNPDRLFIDAGNTTSYNLLSGHGSIDNYLQLNVQNFSAGATASSDIVATANNGDEDNYYINMGINSSGYNIEDGVGSGNDSYLFNTGGDLLIGNASTNKRVIIFNGGTPALENARIYITQQGTVGINASDTNDNNPEALLIEPLPGNPANTFSNLIIGRGTVNESYLQFNLINLGTGSYASADIVASNDISTETSNYIDMGINSSNHIVDTTFAPGGPNDSYLLSTARDLLIGSSTSGSIILWTGTNFDDKANAKLTLRNNNIHSLTGSLSATQGFTGSLFGTSSWAQNAVTASYILQAVSASFASTASSADNFTVRGTLTAQTIVVQTITSSTDFVTGSTKFGSLSTDTHQFTGSVSITGSLNVTGPTTINDLTGSLFGTASWANNATTASYILQAVSASFATSASQATTASYILQAESASFATSASQAITASYVQTAQTASYVLNAISASFATSASQATTASYILQAVSASFATSASQAVTASYILQAVSASFATNATNATNASTASYVAAANVVGTVTSASHADQASNATTADFASIAGNGGVTNIVAGAGITLIPTNGVGAVTVISSGGGGVTIISGSNVTQSFNNSNTWTFNHNLGTRTPIITIFDTNYKQIIPQDIELVNTASATITFPIAESGFAVASSGGTSGTAFSSSYSQFSTYATTASYYAETDPVFVAKSASLATTGSNTFRGNQTVTGSLFTSGSNTLTGNTTLSGSINISGSQTFNGTSISIGTQTVTGSLLTSGSNTLVGNTILSGSINISGSSTIRGTTVMSGSLNINGSTTQTGNNTLVGTTTLTGSILINGNIVPELSSSFDLGSETNPWRSLYVQSGSISIQSDIPGGVSAVISNANGNVTIAGAGFQIKTGSFVPFEISSTARTIIRVPNIPANDVGGLSIIGSSDGSYQGVTNAGGLLHLTSNDGQSSRITSDAFGTTAVAAYVGRKARGTAASPLPVQAGDTLTRISTIGWTGPEYGFTMSASAVLATTAIETIALDNFTTSSFGTRYNFYNAPLGGTIRTLSAQIDTTGITIPSSSRLFGTSSWASNAQTASYVTASNVVGTVLSSSYAITASFAPNYVLNSVTSSMLQPYVLSSATSSFITNSQTGSFATTGSNRFNGNQTITGSLLVSGSTTHTGSLLITGSTTHVGNVTITGSLRVSGSLTEIGDTVLTGSLSLSSGSRLNINDGLYVNGNKQFNYGQFSSTQTQSGSANTAYSATFNTTQFSQGVTLVDGSKITVSNTGIYNIQFSSQLHTTANQAVDFSIWFAMTGSNIADSNTEFTIEKINGGGFQVAALNFLTQISSGSYIELKYSKTTTQGQLYAIGTQSSPTRPATPSVILTVTQIA